MDQTPLSTLHSKPQTPFDFAEQRLLHPSSLFVLMCVSDWECADRHLTTVSNTLTMDKNYIYTCVRHHVESYVRSHGKILIGGLGMLKHRYATTEKLQNDIQTYKQ